MSELTDFMAARAAEAESGDTGNTTPAPEADSAAQSAESTSQTPETETPADAGAADFLDEKFDWNKLNPEVVPLAKQLQADYTRKRQAEAEQVRQAQDSLKQYEGLNPESAQWTRQVEGLLQTNPGLAAQMLEQEAQRIKAQAQPQTPAPNPLDFEPLSDGERALQDRLRQMEQLVQRQEIARARAEVEQQFAKLEQEAGRKIPFEERQKIAAWCQQYQCPFPDVAYKNLNYEAAIQRGRDEASASMQQKSAMGAAPNGVAGREAPAGSREPTTRREAIQMMVEAEQAA